MAVTINNGFVQDGIVMLLDAANKNSYPGTGPTWFDVSPNKYEGDFVGGQSGYLENPPLSPLIQFGKGANVGGIDTADICRTNLIANDLGNGPFSVYVSCAALSRDPNNTTFTPGRLVSANRSDGGTKWCLGVNSSNELCFGGSGGVEGPAFSQTITDIRAGFNTIALIHRPAVGTIPANYDLYVGQTASRGFVFPTKVLSVRATSTVSSSTTSGISIGGRPATTDRRIGGFVQVVAIYNREITEDEIIRNYYSLRRRWVQS